MPNAGIFLRQLPAKVSAWTVFLLVVGACGVLEGSGRAVVFDPAVQVLVNPFAACVCLRIQSGRRAACPLGALPGVYLRVLLLVGLVWSGWLGAHLFCPQRAPALIPAKAVQCVAH